MESPLANYGRTSRQARADTPAPVDPDPWMPPLSNGRKHPDEMPARPQDLYRAEYNEEMINMMSVAHMREQIKGNASSRTFLP
jgi:hypothetical protein